MKINEIGAGIDDMKKNGRLPSDFEITHFYKGFVLGCSTSINIVWNKDGNGYRLLSDGSAVEPFWNDEENRLELKDSIIMWRNKKYDIKHL